MPGTEPVKGNNSEQKELSPQDRLRLLQNAAKVLEDDKGENEDLSTQLSQSGGVVLSDAQKEEMDSYEFTDEEKQWAIQKSNNVDDMLYEKQGGWSMTKRAIGGGLYTGGLGALKTATDMVGMEWFDGDDGDNNFASEFLQERIDQYKEYNPIYSQGTFDAGWWMNGVQGTIDSAVTFALPGGVAGKLTTSAMRLAGARGILANIGSRFLTSALTNQVETQIMAHQMHKDMYNEMIEKGYTHDDATKTVQKSVDDFKTWNRLMIATDYIGMGSLMGAPMFGGAQKSFMQKAKSAGIDAITEAGEEIYGDGLVNHFTNEGLIDSDAISDKRKGAFERSLTWLKDEGWESGFWGVAGGPTQKYGRDGIQYVLDKATGRSKLDMIPEPPKFNEEIPNKPEKQLPEIDIPKHQIYTKDNGDTVVKAIEANGEVEYTQEAWDDRKAEIEAEFQTENASLIKEWDKYQADLDDYNDKKKESEKARKEWEYATRNRSLRSLTGKKGQAIKDVSKFLNEQASLENEWQQAIEKDDIVSQKEILDRKIEGLFLRYAENGQSGDGKGAVESLEKALKDSIEDGSPNAQAAYDKVQDLKDKYNKAYKFAYRTQDPSVARGVAAAVMKAESGIDSSIAAIEIADNKMDELRQSIISKAQKLHPGKQVSLSAEIKSKEIEISALETMASKVNNKDIQSKLRRRKRQLEESLKEDKKNLTDPIDDSDFLEEEIDKLEDLSNKKAENLAAYNSYKTQSANMQKKDYFKNQREERFLEYNNLIKESNNPDVLNAIRQRVQEDDSITKSQKKLAYDYIKDKYNESIEYQKELDRKSEQYKKRSEALRERKNELNKRIRDYYADTLVLEDGKTKTESKIESNQEKQDKILKSIEASADKKEQRKLKRKLKNLKEKAHSLQARINQRKATTLPISALEAQLEQIKEDQADLVTSALSPFSDSLKNNPKLKKALNKLVTEQQLTVKELESLLELPGTNENFKADMGRRIAEAKELEKHTESKDEKNFNNQPGEKIDKKDTEDSKQEGTISNTEAFQERDSEPQDLSRDEEVDRYSKYDEKEPTDPSKIEVEEFLEEEDEIDQAVKEEEKKVVPEEDSSEEEVTDELPFDDDIEEDSTEVLDESKPADEVEPVFVPEQKETSGFDVLTNSQSKMPTAFDIRLGKKDKKLLGGAIWLSDPKNASDKSNTKLKLVVREGKLYWSPNMEVQDNYTKTGVFREVLLPFTSKESFDLENGEGSYDVLAEDVGVYMDEYTTNVINMEWNEMSYSKEFNNPLPNLGIEPNDSQVAISIDRTWSESGTKEGGNTPASWMEDTWTSDVNSIVLNYKTPDGKQANLPVFRSRISPTDAKDITTILKEMFNAAKDPKFSMKTFWNKEYSDPGKFENVTIQEALDSLVDINYSTDVSYTGPDGNLNVDKTGNSAIYIKYKDGKNKRQPILYIRNKEGEITGEYTANEFNDNSKILEIQEQFSDNFLNPAHKWRINKPININTDSATIKGVVMSKGDTWNNFYFKAGTLTTNGQFAQRPKNEGGSYGSHELHGGVKLTFAPAQRVTKNSKRKGEIKPLQKEAIDSDKIYTAASSDISKVLARLC